MKDHKNAASSIRMITARCPSSSELFLGMVSLYLVFSTVWAPKLSGFRYENARWFQLILLTTAVFILVASPGFARGVFERWAGLDRAPRYLIAVTLFGGVLSAIFSPALHIGAMEIGLMTQLVLFAFSVDFVIRRIGRNAERTFCVAILGGAALVIVQFWIVRALSLYENRTFSWISPFLEFANVRFFSQYQAYTLLILPVCAAMLDVQRWHRYFIYFVAANFWALQWMAGSRAVWVGFLMAVFAVILFARGTRVKWVRQQILLVISGAAIFIVYLWAVPQVTTEAPTEMRNSLLGRGTQSVDARYVMAGKAIDFIRARPFSGVGPGQFGLAYRETHAAHPHNSVLQLLSEYGLIAGGAALGIGVCLLILSVARLKPPNAGVTDPINIGLSAALIMGLGDSLFSGNIVMPHSQILLSLLSGWLLARTFPQATSPFTQLPATNATVRMGLIYPVVLGWAITMILSIEYWHATHVYTYWPYWLPDRPPHFWQYGRFSAW